MKHSFRFLWNVLFCLCPLVMAHAEDGSDRMENLIYSPRYFGPNAFPMPTLRDGLVSQWYEAELRGEYHAYTGDKTWDLRGRLLLPFFRGRAGVEIDWCFKEKYKMTPETRDERFAAGTEGGKLSAPTSKRPAADVCATHVSPTLPPIGSMSMLDGTYGKEKTGRLPFVCRRWQVFTAG